MSSTQLTCPHCGSTLNFGNDVAAGTAVQCLICMNSFEAPAPATSAPAPTAAKAGIPVGKPAASSAVTPKTPPPLSKAAKSDTDRRPPRRGTNSSGAGSKLALAAVAIGLVLLLGGAVGVAAWKIAWAPRQDPPGHPDQPLAQNSDDPQGNANPGKGAFLAPPKDDKKLKSDSTTPKSFGPPTDADSKTAKSKEKKGLVRKTPTGTDLEERPELPVAPVVKKVHLTGDYAGLTDKRIDDTIDRGVAYLKKTQEQSGTWANSYEVGHAAIGGLTLLECGQPATDETVRRAATYVRRNIQLLDHTYSISLAVLFLDRLGEPSDRPLIQGMALRLLAGQADCGGWHYQVPVLTGSEMYQLYAFLQSHKQLNLFNPLQDNSKNTASTRLVPKRDAASKNDPFHQFHELVYARGVDGDLDPKSPGVKPKNVTPIRPNWLQGNLQNLMIVTNQGKTKGKHVVRAGAGDNSNTQFALLALWAARRHDVPVDQAILAAYQRFVMSQGPDGGWGYAVNGQSTNTMTCVGLLGEAMGHGVAPDIVKFDPKNPKQAVVRAALDDPRVKLGLRTLARHMGQPMKKGDPSNLPMENLYFLWSVERVAMLYDLTTIEGKEWYPWGAQILVHRQEVDGSWQHSNFHGSIPPLNTCFALLFLKRSNLVQDLTNQMRLYSGIRDTEK